MTSPDFVVLGDFVLMSPFGKKLLSLTHQIFRQWRTESTALFAFLYFGLVAER